MLETEEREPWKELIRLVDEGPPEQLDSYLEQLQPSDVALAISRLTESEQSRLLRRLSAEEAGGIFQQLPIAQVVGLLEQLEPHHAAAILEELSSDHQADLVNELDNRNAEAILDQLTPSAAAEVRALAAYEPESAGGIMVTEFLRFSQEATVDEVIRDLREHADRYSDYDVQYAYVCDQRGRLRGVLRMRDLLLAAPGSHLRRLMITDPLSVRDTASLDEMLEFFARHDFLCAPVVDKRNRLVGVVQKSALDEAHSDRDRSDFLKTQGIVSGEEIRTLPLLLRSRRRLSWLSANIVLNVIAASVIAAYQDTLSAVIALAVFLPIISDMSGCSGNQAVAVSMRELSLGLVRATDLGRVWVKEITVGLLNGLVLGALIGGVAWAWKGNPYLGLVVGIALCLNTMLAVSIGGLVPLMIKRMGMDPAIASGPILTTITDMCGFFLVLGSATLMLPYLSS